MSVIQFVFLFSILGDASAPPADLKQAEIQGLHRLSAAELGQVVPTRLMPHMDRRPTGRLATRDAATRIDKSNHTYCYAPSGRTGDDESCFAIFRAADGVRYFGYDIERGGHPRIWRSFRE